MNSSITRRNLLGASLALGIAAPRLSAAQSLEIVIYTSNPAQAVDAVKEVVEKARPPLRISTITGGSGQLLRRIAAEVQRPQADIFWSSSANTLGDFKALFQPYRSPELAAIPQSLHQPEDLWTATNVHVVVAMLNTRQLGRAQTPKSWADLLDPAWKGKIVIADPLNSSTGYTILWGIEQLLGTEGLKRLAANLTVSSAASAVLRGVGQGEYAVGLTFESNAYGYVAGGQREIKLVYPSEGTFISPEFQVLIKDAPGGATARRAFDLLISKEVQTALLEAAFRRPSRSDIDVAKYVALPAIADIKVFPTDETEAAARRGEFITRWQAILAAAR